MYKKILLPIDEIKSASAAISNAKGLAAATGAEVVLFSVVSTENPIIVHDEHVGGLHASQEVVDMAIQDEERHVEQAEAELQKAVESNGADGVKFSFEVTTGRAQDEIVRYTKENGVDMIIISTHGRLGVSRAFLGSVADEVIHEVEVPVMVVKRS